MCILWSDLRRAVNAQSSGFRSAARGSPITVTIETQPAVLPSTDKGPILDLSFLTTYSE
jgi:hypothetical protein